MNVSDIVNGRLGGPQERVLVVGAIFVRNRDVNGIEGEAHRVSQNSVARHRREKLRHQSDLNAGFRRIGGPFGGGDQREF